MSYDGPKSVRVPCDDGNEWRGQAIQEAADYYGVNKSDAIGRACNDVAELTAAARAILQRDDLTPEQKREIAETLSKRTKLRFSVDTSVSVDK